MSSQISSCTSLVSYKYEDQTEVDCMERVGYILSYPLNQLAGKTYIVKDQTFQELPENSSITKIFIAILMVLLAPLSIPFALFGTLFTKLSTSHQSTLLMHQAILKGNNP